MTSKTLLLLGWARETSTRCPNKMLRPFGETTLFDIYLQKFESIGEHFSSTPFMGIAMALHPQDEELWARGMDSSVPIILRSSYSVNAPVDVDLSRFLHYLEDFKETHVMFVNGCCPFLTEETIIEVAHHFLNSEFDGMTCVHARHNYFWWPENGGLVQVVNPKIVATQSIAPLMETSHSIIIFNREYALENGAWWSFTPGDPGMVEIPHRTEFIDIDTIEDFYMAEKMEEITDVRST